MFDRLVGISLKHKHINQISEENSNVACLNIGWFEVHSENYLTLGGLGFDKLLEIRKNYQISLHGIGMSLGSSDGLDINYLNQIKNLIDAVDPFLVSDHLSWSSISDHFLPELLPTPFNDESLKIFTDNISFAQEKLGRQILVENPSTYFEFTNSTYSEAEFLNILAKKTGAGVILDINNVYISALNNGWSAEQYINDIAHNIIHEIHLAGHSVKKISDNEALYIDSHDAQVSDEVWSLYKQALVKFGPIPTLIEWDKDIPTLEILLEEAKKAELCMSKLCISDLMEKEDA